MFAGWQNRKKFCPIPKFTNSYPINPTVLVIHIFYWRSLFWDKKFCIITWFIIVLRMGQKQAQNWWHWILPCNIFKINTTPNSNTKNEGSSSSNIKFHLSLRSTFKLLNSVSWIQNKFLLRTKATDRSKLTDPHYATLNSHWPTNELHWPINTLTSLHRSAFGLELQRSIYPEYYT